MYLGPEIIASLEAQYGRPESFEASTPFSEREFRLLEHVGRRQRAHDVTLFIQAPDWEQSCRFAVIRKPSYPAEVFRPPSGGVEPDEAFELGAAREALEETGLRIELTRYVARVAARFSHAGREAAWTTHVFLARTPDAELSPTDLREIAEARWASVAELMDRYRPAMLALGTAGMRYRVELQDLTLQALDLATAPTLPGPPLIRRCSR